jgi:hypothetical protein
MYKLGKLTHKLNKVRRTVCKVCEILHNVMFNICTFTIMYRLTVGYLHDVFDYIPMYQIMYLTSNQVKLYASLIFAGTTKPACRYLAVNLYIILYVHV